MIKIGILVRLFRMRSIINIGAIAQLVEHFVRNEKVTGSIPVSSTIKLKVGK